MRDKQGKNKKKKKKSFGTKEGEWVRSQKLSHKMQYKHEKEDPPRFSDNPQVSPLK
jgi:hypothetical protein